MTPGSSRPSLIGQAMNAADSRFIEYLEAKRSVDDRSLHPRVWAAFLREAEELRSRGTLEIAELGAGIGTMCQRVFSALGAGVWCTTLWTRTPASSRRRPDGFRPSAPRIPEVCWTPSFSIPGTPRTGWTGCPPAGFSRRSWRTPSWTWWIFPRSWTGSSLGSGPGALGISPSTTTADGFPSGPWTGTGRSWPRTTGACGSGRVRIRYGRLGPPDPRVSPGPGVLPSSTRGPRLGRGPSSGGGRPTRV